jgi:hypothetical protein
MIFHQYYNLNEISMQIDPFFVVLGIEPGALWTLGKYYSYQLSYPHEPHATKLLQWNFN